MKVENQYSAGKPMHSIKSNEALVIYVLVPGHVLDLTVMVVRGRASAFEGLNPKHPSVTIEFPCSLEPW